MTKPQAIEVIAMFAVGIAQLYLDQSGFLPVAILAAIALGFLAFWPSRHKPGSPD